ncbi:hypothetical protein QR680_011033 [Steinernema hermaphroditum]|uniref:Uncharacterized protein n=1 Tax=Steinernema hermaphroditum TaxID=289476 RepID=A0AA39IQX8_9BILA|nr:hypothetical protein QR680_011033 [Steinernema hermaphroditum]
MRGVNLTRFLALAAYLICGAVASNDSYCQPGQPLLEAKNLAVLYTSCRDVYLFDDRPTKEIVEPSCEKMATKMFLSKEGVVHLIFETDSDSQMQNATFTLFDFPEKGEPSRILTRMDITGVCHPARAKFHNEKLVFENADFDIVTGQLEAKPGSLVNGTMCSPNAPPPKLVDVLTGETRNEEDVSGNGSLIVEQKSDDLRLFHWMANNESMCIFEARRAESIIIVSSTLLKNSNSSSESANSTATSTCSPVEAPTTTTTTASSQRIQMRTGARMYILGGTYGLLTTTLIGTVLLVAYEHAIHSMALRSAAKKAKKEKKK